MECLPADSVLSRRRRRSDSDRLVTNESLKRPDRCNVTVVGRPKRSVAKYLGTTPRENARLTAANGKPVLMVEAIPVEPGDEFELQFGQASDSARQGVWLAVDGELEVAGMKAAQVEVWKDTAPASVGIRILAAESGVLWLYNVWDRRTGFGKESQADFAGMLKEPVADGATYRCNTIGPTPNFEALTFTLVKHK